MFQTRTKRISALITLFALTALPLTAQAQVNADVPPTPAAQTQSVAPIYASDNKANFLQEEYYDELRFEAKAKLSETQVLEKLQAAQNEAGALMGDLEAATDSLQDRLSPVGQSIKSSVKAKLPGIGLLHFGDRTFSVFGLILMMSFALVLLLMSLANPTSRLGGRH